MAAVLLLLIFWKGLLLGVDFHDFDPYQYQLTKGEVAAKIERYLEKDPEIRKFYQLTEEALYIGGYVLYFSIDQSKPPAIPKTARGLKGLKVALDPGHFGGRYAEWEERCTKVAGLTLREGDLTYLTAILLKELLEEAGADVFVTRTKLGEGVVPVASLSRTLRSRYLREDLRKRAEMINQFSPDTAIVIHYNITPESESNYSLAFIPGAFCKGELDDMESQYEFLRLVVTDNLERSLKLSECIVKEFRDHLHVPLIRQNENTSYLRPFCLFQSEGVYSRNLVLTRLIHSPVCYGEALIQNNLEEAVRLASGARIQEVAEAYFKGIEKACLEEKLFSCDLIEESFCECNMDKAARNIETNSLVKSL